MTCVILCMYSTVEDLYHYQRYIKNKYYYYYYMYLVKVKVVTEKMTFKCLKLYNYIRLSKC